MDGGIIGWNTLKHHSAPRGLKSCEEFIVLPEATPNQEPSWFSFSITIREEININRVDLINYQLRK